MTTARIIVRDRFYVPRHAVDMRRLREVYEVPLATKEDCHPGCPLAQKPGRYCARCPSKDSRIKLWEPITTKGGNELIAVPAGNMELLRQIVGSFELIDRRNAPPFRSALKWTGRMYKKGDLDDQGRPRADQVGMLRAWLTHVHSGETGGLIVSPPRSGKTVVGVGASVADRVRTIITASEINWLRQFGKRFGENTNVRKLARNGKSPVVLVAPGGWKEAPLFGVQVVKKWGKDTDAADVVMSTYQQLIDVGSRSEKWRVHVANRFGKLICDETDQTAAKAFSRVVNRTNTRYKLGLTATVHRKDKLERCCHPDSKVVTGEGIMRINDVSIGNNVLSHNHITGVNEYSRVLAKHSIGVGKMIRVSFGDDSVIVTPDHKFWSVTRQTYVCAVDLELSDELLLVAPSKTEDPN